MTKIIHKELSYIINGLLFKVHNDLNRFCREKQYADKFEKILKDKKIKYKREFELKNIEPESPSGNRVDFLIEDKIIIDFKAKKIITKEDYYQMQRYLKASNLELGLIVNFRNSYLKPKRVLNSDFYSDNSDKDSGHSSRLRGFTLIEMIIATALFLIAITASIGIFLSTTRANSRINAMQKVENEVRYIVEKIAKEARLGTIYYEIYGSVFENPALVLAVLDNADNVSYFALNGDEGNPGIVQMSLDDGDTWSDLNSDSVTVDSLDFYLLPSSDPFAQDAESIEQPMVTLHLKAHYNVENVNAGKIEIQTTISSRQYKK